MADFGGLKGILLKYQFLETKMNHFRHYVLRWFLVPRKMQLVIRYFAIAIFVLYTFLALVIPELYGQIKSGPTIHLFLGIFVLYPLIGATISSIRFESRQFEVEISQDYKSFVVRNHGIEATVRSSVIKNTKSSKIYIRITLKTESFDEYLYFFKSQTTDAEYSSFCSDILKIEKNAG